MIKLGNCELPLLITGLAGYHIKDAVTSAKTKLDEIQKACTKPEDKNDS